MSLHAATLHHAALRSTLHNYLAVPGPVGESTKHGSVRTSPQYIHGTYMAWIEWEKGGAGSF